MRNRFLVSLLTTVAATATLSLASAPPGSQSAASGPQAIRRMLDGKPDFSGVWAGPAFSHKVGPGDTDSPSPTRFDPKIYADLFRPGEKNSSITSGPGTSAMMIPRRSACPSGFHGSYCLPIHNSGFKRPETLWSFTSTCISFG